MLCNGLIRPMAARPVGYSYCAGLQKTTAQDEKARTLAPWATNNRNLALNFGH